MDTFTTKTIAFVVLFIVSTGLGLIAFQRRRTDLALWIGMWGAAIAIEIGDKTPLSVIVLIVCGLWLGFRNSGWRQL